MPVIYLFYKENNFSVTELFVLHAIYSLIIAVLEVPSGYVADVWGRKTALVTGTLLGSIGFFVYSQSYFFIGFVLAEVLLGIGQSLLSGADSALLYDTLLQQKKERNYIKVEGRITASGNFAEALAGLFVSLFVFETVRVNFYIQAGLAFLAFIVSVFLVEPTMHSKRNNPGIKDILQIVNHTLRQNRVLRDLVIFSSIIGFASLTMAWFAQPIFTEIGLPKQDFGYAWVVLNLLVAAGSLLSVKLGSVSMKKILFLLAIPLSVGFITSAFSLNLWVIVSLVIFYIIRGTAHPILKKYINDITDSGKRATVLSIRSLVIRVIYSGFGPLLGYWSDNISLKFALLMCGSTVLILSLITISSVLLSMKRQPGNNS
ncbi:MAG: MFS transporter [Bacteroidales bacterium]|nr:MFS transporter [Bacteroidales bacterium]MBN2819287.1 MFS transporter [Bacteroidales bacterium]